MLTPKVLCKLNSKFITFKNSYHEIILNNKVNNLKVNDLNTTSNIIDFVVGEISSDGEEETIKDEPLYKFAKSELDNRKDFLKKVFKTDN